MKIFNRGNDSKAPAASAPAATHAPAGPAAVVAAPAPVAAAPLAAPAPPPAPAAPPAPDLSVILDANVREMSEKIARLATSIESQQQERGSFEAKLEQMEERMRKLSSLTEMISAQYNPFVGDAPSERDPLPKPEVGLAPPPSAPSLMPPLDAAPLSLAIDAPPIAAPAISLDPMPAPPAFEPAPPAFEPAPMAPELAPMPPAPAYEPPVAAPAPPQEAAAHVDDIREGVHVWAVPPGFESSMLLLGWADMLLKSAGSRESLLELVNYYHNIGWIGDPARDQLLAYADGIAASPASEPAGDWRANVEVHEKSLLFVEKLRAVTRRG